jgi:hypothetical protein
MGVGQNGMIGTPQQAEVIILIRRTFRSTVRAWLVEVDFTMTQRAGTVRGSMGIGLHLRSIQMQRCRRHASPLTAPSSRSDLLSSSLSSLLADKCAFREIVNLAFTDSGKQIGAISGSKLSILDNLRVGGPRLGRHDLCGLGGRGGLGVIGRRGRGKGVVSGARAFGGLRLGFLSRGRQRACQVVQ